MQVLNLINFSNKKSRKVYLLFIEFSLKFILASNAEKRVEKIIKDLSIVLVTELPKLWKLTTSIQSGVFYTSLGTNPNKVTPLLLPQIKKVTHIENN